MPNGFNFEVALTWATNVLSTVPFAAGMTGYFFGHLNKVERVALLVAACLLIIPGVMTDGIGLLITCGIGVYEHYRGKRALSETMEKSLSV